MCRGGIGIKLIAESGSVKTACEAIIWGFHCQNEGCWGYFNSRVPRVAWFSPSTRAYNGRVIDVNDWLVFPFANWFPCSWFNSHLFRFFLSHSLSLFLILSLSSRLFNNSSSLSKHVDAFTNTYIIQFRHASISLEGKYDIEVMSESIDLNLTSVYMRGTFLPAKPWLVKNLRRTLHLILEDLSLSVYQLRSQEDKVRAGRLF